MTERRPIYRKSDGLVINIWEEFDPDGVDADWVPVDYMVLGPPSAVAMVGDTFNGTDYDAAPVIPVTPDPIDQTPGTVDILQYLIDEGLTTKGAVVAQFPEIATELR